MYSHRLPLYIKRIFTSRVTPAQTMVRYALQGYPPTVDTVHFAADRKKALRIHNYIVYPQHKKVNTVLFAH